MNDDLLDLLNKNKKLEKRLLEFLPAAIYVTDAQGRLSYYNSAAIEFSGRKPEIGTDQWCVIWKLYHPDGSPMPHEKCPMAVSLKEERSINGAEAIAELPNGERRWFKAYPSPLYNTEGEVIGGINMLIDVSEKKNVEEKLSQNEQELNDFFKNVNVGIHWVNADGIIKRANQAELYMLGYSREEYIGSHIADFHVDEEVIDDILTKLGNREELIDCEARLKCKDGSIKYVLINSSVYENNGEFVHTRCVTHDITERKNHELNDALLSAIVEGSDDAIISKDLDSIITSWNDGAERIFGYTAEEVIGQPITLLFPQDRLNEEVDIISQIRKGERVDHFETKRKRKDGSLLDVSLTISPIRDSDGKIVGASKIVRNITKRKEAEQKLEEMNETLEERVEKRTKKLRAYQRQLRSLASQLNKAEERERQRLATELHDRLGQMLAVAKMKASGLQHGNLPDQSSSEVKELKQIVDDALTYNQNLMAELKPPPVLDKEDVTEVLYWTAKKMEKQGLGINIENDEASKPVAKEIRTILHQSVRELLQNIIKHAGVDEARLVISRKKNQVRITIEDEGKGFDVEKNMLSPTEEGRFGLFNIQERMDWHGGSFEIESEPGKGTKATLYAPLKEQEKQPAEEVLPSSEKEEPEDEAQKIKILLVDDHEMMRRGLRQMIEKQDDLIVAEEASDGKEAVEQARETSPHVVIMDVNMPVMDRIEATQKLKEEIPGVQIIGLSLHDSPEVVEDMRNAGASDYLTKSEAFESLIATIRSEVSARKSTKKM